MDNEEMNSKLLSVSVAAYNMEDYIEQCLDSCLCGEMMNRLEVLIVDDGSSDSTAALAQSYVERYPGTFRLLSKPNGGYGSTVNLSMEEATGKYFRLLDADDWFGKGSLQKLISLLDDCEADAIITPMYRCVEGKEPCLVDDSFGIEPEKVVPVGALPDTCYISMWRLSIKTELLQKDRFELPEHCVFTDQLYVANCICRSETIIFFDVPLYEYRIGRDGQSVAPESRIAHKKELEFVTSEELSLFEGLQRDDKKQALLGTVAAHYSTYLKLLLMLPRSRRNFNEIRRWEKRLHLASTELYKAAGFRKLTRILRNSHYLAYWPLTLLDLRQKKYWEPK